MFRLILFLLVIAAIAAGLSWLADRPGDLVIHWQGFLIETSVFRAVVILSIVMALALMIWNLLRYVWDSPALIGRFLGRRRQKKGLDALSAGMIAIGAGDRVAASRFAVQARRQLPNEPMTHLLRAQAAHLSGDKITARRIFEAMLNSPDTEQLGLRGLFLEAEREGEKEAAYQFAERAVRLNPRLEWSINALFVQQCKVGDWAGALETLASAKRHGHVDKESARRRRAVLLTAQAQTAEDDDPERALSLALDAHKAAPDLVPAAVIAGRILASRGNTPRATRIVQRTWRQSPHPDLATVYAYARIGDSPRDRLERVQKLAASSARSQEGQVAVAAAAIEAKDFDAARQALEPLLKDRPSQRVCSLMARIDGEQHGDRGRVREWLARAVNAPRDPAWTADGIVSDTWAPTSPVTGALDAFQWRVPVERVKRGDAEALVDELEQQVSLDAAGVALGDGDGLPPHDRNQTDPIAIGKPDSFNDEGQASFGSATSGEGFDDAESASVTDPNDGDVGRSDLSSTSEPVSVTLPPPANPLDGTDRNEIEGSATSLRSDTAPLNTRMRRKKSIVSQIDEAETHDPEEDEARETRQEVLEDADIFVAPPLPDDPGPEGADPDLPDDSKADTPRYPKRIPS